MSKFENFTRIELLYAKKYSPYYADIADAVPTPTFSWALLIQTKLQFLIW